MADASRRAEVTAAVEYVVKPGEAWLVRGYDDKVEVTEHGQASLVDRYPELRGFLLQLEARLKNTATLDPLVIWLAALGICLALHMHWLDAILADRVERLRSGWVYAFLCAVFFVISGRWVDFRERTVYRKYRSLLLDKIGQAGISPQRLIAELEGGPFKNISEQLKADGTLFASGF